MWIINLCKRFGSNINTYLFEQYQDKIAANAMTLTHEEKVAVLEGS